MSADTRSRLCPEHRNNSNPTSCVACAQARQIAELEQTVEQVVDRNECLTERVEALEADDQDDVKKPIEIALPESESS